jgi:hypothetical protein
VLAVVGWLQKEKKNSPPLHPGADEAQNFEAGGADD